MRQTKYGTRLKSIVSEVYNDLLVEVFDREIETKYEKFSDTIDVFRAEIYRFKTNSNTFYDLEFMDTYIIGRSIMFDYSYLHERIKDLEFNETYPSVDIAFTLTERITNNRSDIDNSSYTLETNKNETIELMSRIMFLVKKYIEDHPETNVYIIGLNTKAVKLQIYKKMWENIFSKDFELIEGSHFGYPEGALYFLNKNIIEYVNS